MKILTVCGMGSGSSLILKMNIDDILLDNGIDAEVEACDAGSALGRDVDLIITTREFGDVLLDCDIPKVLLTNVIDKTEIEKKLREALKF